MSDAARDSVLKAGKPGPAKAEPPGRRAPHPKFRDVRPDILHLEQQRVQAMPTALLGMLRRLDESQWLAPEVIAAAQLRQLGALAEHLSGHSGHFRMRLRKAGLNVADLVERGGLSHLPPLRRRDLQTGRRLFCDVLPPGHGPVHEQNTSGSTGIPVTVRRTGASQADWDAFTMREHLWSGRDFRGKACFNRSLDNVSRLPNWGKPAGLLFATGPAMTVPVNLPIEEQLALIADLAPTSLLTYPNNLVGLMGAIEARGVGLPSIRDVRTVGETVTEELREDARRVLGAEISDTYSAYEIGYMALQCPDAPLYHVMAEAVIVEVLNAAGEPCAEGEVGRIVVTDLHNYATPLVRYENGDYAEAGPASCPCGRGLPTLKRIMGRERNLMVMPDGRKAWPTLRFDSVRKVAPVVRYQMVQLDRTRFELRLVTQRPLTGAEEAAMQAMLERNLRRSLDLRFSYFPNELPRGANGKLEQFLCLAT